MAKKLKVIYVDDEENNLNSFKSFFRKEYEVYTAISAEEAFKIMTKNEMNIIVTDQRMPVMTGVEFLEQTLQKFPDAVRLLITGYADIKLVTEAINRGQVNKYIEKPWNWDSLKLLMENCSDLYLNRRILRLKNIELQKSNDELNRFIYSATHDLRSPLMSILGIIQLAKMEKNLTLEYVEIIEKNILKLDRYVKNIITYYQNSRLEESFSKINFKQIIEAEIDMLFDTNEIVEFDVETNQEGEFVGDFFRIRIIINNLISNAIKYSNPQNKDHRVSIKVESDSTAAKIIVSDNGIGINEDQIESIFKIFYRAQGTAGKKGSGIGLFIVKESLEKINGTIAVKSTPLQGSSFEVIIPNKVNSQE